VKKGLTFSTLPCGRAIPIDASGRADVIRGHRVAQVQEDEGVVDGLNLWQFILHTVEEWRIFDVC